MDGLTASFEPDFTPPSPPKSGNPSAAPAEARQEKPEPKHEPEPPEILEDNALRHAAVHVCNPSRCQRSDLLQQRHFQ